MSSHCHRYPGCNCPKEVGFGCHISDDEEREKLIKRVNSGATVIKTDGECNPIEVPNPDRYADSAAGEIRLRKYRRKITNLTPPKRKRKKRQ